MPERFSVTAMLVRDGEKGKAIEARWGVKTYRNLDGFVRHGDFQFAVVSVAREAAPYYIEELTQYGIPVLTETPPAGGLQDLIRLHESLGQQAKVQVAEQYVFQSMHAARIAFAHSGKLGDISQVQMSAAHGYHGISLIRRLVHPRRPIVLRIGGSHAGSLSFHYDDAGYRDGRRGCDHNPAVGSLTGVK